MRSFARLLSENLVVGVLVLAVVVISDQVREPWHSLATTAVAIALVAYAIRLSLSQYRQHKELRVRQSARAQPPIREGSTGSVLIGRYNRAIKLSQLTELGQFLQSCASEAEAYQLVGNALARFLPECSGALYKVLRGGQRVETISQWGTHPPQETIFDPAECWAVRRGRAHKGNRGATPVNCAHLTLSEKETSLCVPILVQGETAGVLVLLPNPDVPPVRGDRLGNTVARIRRVGTAVAEQMALTLNNLQVRAALRAQAIRDPLTGLFNRRYLEETLERELHTPSAETAPFLS